MYANWELYCTATTVGLVGVWTDIRFFARNKIPGIGDGHHNFMGGLTHWWCDPSIEVELAYWHAQKKGPLYIGKSEMPCDPKCGRQDLNYMAINGQWAVFYL